MCNIGGSRTPNVAAQVVATPDGAEATRRGTIEGLRRRRRAGVAANILTGPAGIPASNAQLGGAAT